MKKTLEHNFVKPLLGILILVISTFVGRWIGEGDKEVVQHDIEIKDDHLKTYDSIVSIYARQNEALKHQVNDLNEKVLIAIENNKQLTQEAIIVIEDSLYSRDELDSIRQNLLK